jgi:chemotaxis protein methyltransferase CheR
MKREAPETLEKEILGQLSAQIRERIGLNFVPERWGDLERGLRGAAGDFGFQGNDAAHKCAQWLLAEPLLPAQIDTLARHLTIGETYFFRDPAVFDALRQQILPDLVRARQERGEKTLRFWSAACCSGEEPYSLAMLLAQTLPALLPDWREWNVRF